MLSSGELLAGSELTYVIEVSPELLHPDGGMTDASANTVRLRPLTINDIQLISRAAKESDSLVATLMVQRALVEPEMTVMEVTSLPVGLVQFLLEQVNTISGITTSAQSIAAAAEDPLAKAAFVLARAYGWTPEQVADLTLGQVLLHLQMLREAPQP